MDTDRHVDLDWNEELVTQLEWHWDRQLRPRLDGLTDAEYFWEPVPGCWSIRRRVEATAPLAMGAGELVMDFAMPAPQPEPVTTIAWRLAHITMGVLAWRNASHFGGPPVDWGSWEYAGTAADALRQLDEQHAAWIKGVRGLGATQLAHPVGQAEGPFAESPMATLVLHIHREVIHHGAEISLLRDLYQWKGDQDGL
ncbi:MAG: DinB family protein [Streptosporangiaceae bacterium]